MEINEDLIAPGSALPDTRPESKKKKDFISAEVASASAAVPFQNSRLTKLVATVFNQWYTSSCVPHAMLTQLEYEGLITKKTLLSQLAAYRKRANYSGEGSNGPDMYDQILSGQSKLEDAPVTKGMTEKMANALKRVIGSQLIAKFRYFQILDAKGNIDHAKVAEKVAAGKAIVVFVWFSKDEWSKEYVTLDDPKYKLEGAYGRHAVVLVPKRDFTKNGIEYFTVHDSAAFGNRHLRYMPYEFFKKRCYFAAEVYPVGSIPTPPAPDPVGKPTKACKLGDENKNVTALQTFLNEGGFLEAEYVTGYYGALTAKAVLWYQLYNHLKFDENIPALLELKGEYWGADSIKTVK